MELRQIELAVEYNRGGARRQGLPSVKVHVSFDEPLLDSAVLRTVQSRFPDVEMFQVSAYTLTETAAEKMRALLQQQGRWPRPRDLYDLWYILCHRRETMVKERVRQVFARKCAVKGIAPDVVGLTSAELKEWNRESWQGQVVPMLTTAPLYEQVWQEWTIACRELMS